MKGYYLLFAAITAIFVTSGCKQNIEYHIVQKNKSSGPIRDVRIKLKRDSKIIDFGMGYIPENSMKVYMYANSIVPRLPDFIDVYWVTQNNIEHHKKLKILLPSNASEIILTFQDKGKISIKYE